MCGESNPDDLEVCQFCEARLSPLLAPSQTDGPAAERDSGADLPDWSRSDWQDEQDTEDLFSLDGEEPGDWLNRLQETPEPEDNLLSQPEAEDSPAEFEELDQEESDWLQRIRNLHQADQETQPDDSGTQTGDEIFSNLSQDSTPDDDNLDTLSDQAPDRLSMINDKFPSDSSSESTVDSSADGEAIPDWIDGDFDELEGEQDTQEPSEKLDTDPSSKPQGEEIPDWLSSLEPESEADEVEDGETLPDWLTKIDADQQDTPDTSQRPGDIVPDWLNKMGEGASASGGETQGALPGAGVGTESGSPDDDALHEWFSELDADLDHTAEPTPEEDALEGEEIPGWLKSLGTVVTGTIEDDSAPEIDDGGISPFLTQDDFGEEMLDIDSLPDWLTPEMSVPEGDEVTLDPNLSPADLPGWLAAIRPVDKRTPEVYQEEGPTESAGPLAGLRNVLPAEPEIVHFKKPPAYSAKLRVNSTQQAQAEIFQELLSLEGKATTIPEPRLVSSQRALRWLIAFILTVVIGFVVISETQIAPLPGNTAIPASTYAASRIINALPDQSLVLMAFDYEPGTAGEMHAASAALVDHLMLKGVQLALVSTQPTGPAIAEHFIKTTQRQHSYASGEQYINLGYIPGGATGLLSFAQTPVWVFPKSYSGIDPWQTQLLKDVDAISDFNLVVVITNDPETARTWIEQVQPRIGNTPLLTVVSAQAEPMIRPYFGTDDSAQVRGIISGLYGGAAYEVAVGKPNLSRDYWDAFSVGLILAVGAILIGGIINITQILLTQSKPKKQEAAR
jgi:hypothetical protein